MLGDLSVRIRWRVAHHNGHFAQSGSTCCTQPFSAEVHAVPAVSIGGMDNDGLKNAVRAAVDLAWRRPPRTPAQTSLVWRVRPLGRKRTSADDAVRSAQARLRPTTEAGSGSIGPRASASAHLADASEIVKVTQRNAARVSRCVRRSQKRSERRSGGGLPLRIVAIALYDHEAEAIDALRGAVVLRAQRQCNFDARVQPERTPPLVLAIARRL